MSDIDVVLCSPLDIMVYHPQSCKLVDSIWLKTHGYDLDDEMSNDCVKVNYNKKTQVAVIVVKGMSTKNLSNSISYFENCLILIKIKNKYKNNKTISLGHCLGGAFLSNVFKDKLDKVYTFNRPFCSTNNSNSCIENYKMKYDIISLFAQASSTSKPITIIDKLCYKKTHDFLLNTPHDDQHISTNAWNTIYTFLLENHEFKSFENCMTIPIPI